MYIVFFMLLIHFRTCLIFIPGLATGRDTYWIRWPGSKISYCIMLRSSRSFNFLCSRILSSSFGTYIQSNPNTLLHTFYQSRYSLCLFKFKVRKSSEVPDSDLELMDTTADASLFDSTVEALPKGSRCGKCSLFKFMEVPPLAWVILPGESVHNLLDGVAIATGFVESPSIGLTLALCSVRRITAWVRWFRSSYLYWLVDKMCSVCQFLISLCRILGNGCRITYWRGNIWRILRVCCHGWSLSLYQPRRDGKLYFL